jgi:flagellar biogenesis protein FliO
MRIPVLRPAAKDERGNSRMTAVWQRLSRYWSVIRIDRAPRQLHVSETLQIGEKRQLLVVDVGERQLLIGAAGNCLTMLAELDGPSKSEADGCA